MNQPSAAGANVNPSVAANVNRGYRFTANSAITVTQLGMEVPGAATGLVYNLKLWNFTTQQMIASATLTANGTETWQWATLGSPVALTSGQDYIVTLSSAANNWAYFYSTSPTYLPSGVVQYVEMRYSNTTDVFPTNVLSQINYGFVDIGYGPVAVPTPISNTALVSLTALLALGGVWAMRGKQIV